MLCEKARRKLPRLGCNGALDQNRLSVASSLPPQLSVGDYKHARTTGEAVVGTNFRRHCFAFCSKGLLSYKLSDACCPTVMAYAPFSTNGNLRAAPTRFPSSQVLYGPRLIGVGRMLSSRAHICCRLVAAHCPCSIGLRFLY